MKDISTGYRKLIISNSGNRVGSQISSFETTSGSVAWLMDDSNTTNFEFEEVALTENARIAFRLATLNVSEVSHLIIYYLLLLVLYYKEFLTFWRCFLPSRM